MDKLPEIAALIATHMRDILGCRDWYARVILPSDPDTLDDTRPYIGVGMDFVNDGLMFCLVRRDADWSLSQVIWYPATRHEPGASDFRSVLVSASLPAILAKMAEITFRDLLALAQQALEDDIHMLLNGRSPYEYRE